MKEGEQRLDPRQAVLAMIRMELRDRLAFVRAMSALASECGAEAKPLGEGHLFDGGVHAEHLSVWVSGLGEAPCPEETLAGVEAYFRERGRTPRAWVWMGWNDPLQGQLESRGWVTEEKDALHLWTPASGMPKQESSAGVQVAFVDSSRMQDYLDTGGCCWLEKTSLTPDDLLIGRAFTANEHSTGFLATVEGQPVGTSSVALDGEYAVLRGGCTLPDYRRRGVQRALITARLRYALEQGCRGVMIGGVSGGPTQRNVIRLGFEQVGLRRIMIQR